MAGLFAGYGSGRPARPPAPPRRPGYPGSVATGAGTRAYREGYRSPGMPLFPAAPGAAGAPATPAAGAAAPTWTPPPLGSYDPTRDVEIEQGQSGLGQLKGQIATEHTRDTSDYYNRLGAIQKAQSQEGQDYQTAKEALQRSYAQLGTRQGEQAARYGVTSGGALLQAAAKRAANQGREQGQADVGHERRGEAFNTQLAELALQLAPPDSGNPLGGRSFQDLATKLADAEATQAQYTEGQHRLESSEAARAGYEPPPGASPAAPAHHAAPGRPGGKPGGKPPAHPFRRYRRGL